MIRVVLDTNILVSALTKRGKPRFVLELVAAGNYRLVCSPWIVQELQKVLLHKFKWSHAAVAMVTEYIGQLSDLVTPAVHVSDCIDPDDNRILEAAVEGQAKCIITGDKHLLRMIAFRGIEILTADSFLKRLEAGA